jgi:transcriptional regulator with XRE-family HTH domain
MAELLLDKILKRKGISKRRFAKLLGVHYRAVFRFFEDGYDPKLSMLSRWSKTLGVKISSLYRDK